MRLHSGNREVAEASVLQNRDLGLERGGAPGRRSLNKRVVVWSRGRSGNVK